MFFDTDVVKRFVEFLLGEWVRQVLVDISGVSGYSADPEPASNPFAPTVSELHVRH
jgi:hypothetical protein